MHVVGAQAQVAVELEDLHAAAALLGVAAQRFEVAGAALLGRFLGRALFLLLPWRPGRRWLHAARPAEAARRHLRGRRPRERQRQRRGGDARTMRRRRRPDHAAAPCGPARTARTARRPVAAGCRNATCGRARPGAASRRSAGRPPPSAWPARRCRSRPRSRRGAGRGRGCARKRASAALPAGAQISTAASSSGRRSACRNATSVVCPATVSRAPVGQPEQRRQVVRGGVTIRDGERDVIDSLDLDHCGAGRWGRRAATRIARATYLEPWKDSR